MLRDLMESLGAVINTSTVDTTINTTFLSLHTATLNMDILTTELADLIMSLRCTLPIFALMQFFS